jgi:hypothetical protein
MKNERDECGAGERSGVQNKANREGAKLNSFSREEETTMTTTTIKVIIYAWSELFSSYCDAGTFVCKFVEMMKAECFA